MGADLLLTNLTHDEGKKLDWTKGRQLARKLPIETVQAGLEEADGEAAESAKAARTRLNDFITALKNELKDDSARDAYDLRVAGKVIHIRGGTSWGEDPSEGWTTFVNMWAFPQVLNAIGFDVELDQSAQVDEWAREHGEEVRVMFTVPVAVVVNLREGTVEQVEVYSEEVKLDEDADVEQVASLTTVVDEMVAKWAKDIADDPGTEWPAWTHN